MKDELVDKFFAYQIERHKNITDLVKERSQLKMEIAEIKATTVSAYSNTSTADLSKLSEDQMQNYLSFTERLQEIERQLTTHMM